MAHYLGELTESSMKNLQTLIDSNSVIGKEVITPDGTVILPVSRVSFGFGTGGGDLPATQKELFGGGTVEGGGGAALLHLGGGTGGGVSITPLAFLIVKNSDVKLLQVQSYSNTADRVVGMVPEVVDKVSGLINSKKAAPEAE